MSENTISLSRRILFIDICKIFSILIIFLHHAYLFFSNVEQPIFFEIIHQYGDSVVVIFLILAGFDISIRYFEVFQKLNFTNYFSFIKKRFVSLYPLYLGGIILSLPLSLTQKISHGEVVKLITNLSMCQIFSQNDTMYFSFNSLSWYIACLMFLYLLYPLIVNLLHRMQFQSVRKISIGLLILWIFSFLESLYFTKQNFTISYWFLYITPFGRLINFLSGIGAFMMYKKLRISTKETVFFRIGEILAGVVLLFSIKLLPFIPKVYLFQFFIMPGFTLFLCIETNHQSIFSWFDNHLNLSRIAKLVYPFFIFHQLMIRYVMSWFSSASNPFMLVGIAFMLTGLLSFGVIELPKFFVKISLHKQVYASIKP